MSAGGSVAGPKVFITYRREETAAHAGRIYDAMVARFGEANVFMDVVMTPGVDFVERITEAVTASQVLIVVMGPRWATVENAQGTARIADPDDFVRLEVETALRRPEVTPIPVLVSGARMPSREVLPPEVQAITRRNALELSDSRWRYDIGRLISTLDELLAQTPLVEPPSPERGVGAETATPADAAQLSGETASPPSPDAATTAGETKQTTPLVGVRQRRLLLLIAIAIAAVAAAVVVAVLLDDGARVPAGQTTPADRTTPAGQTTPADQTAAVLECPDLPQARVVKDVPQGAIALIVAGPAESKTEPFTLRFRDNNQTVGALTARLLPGEVFEIQSFVDADCQSGRIESSELGGAAIDAIPNHTTVTIPDLMGRSYTLNLGYGGPDIRVNFAEVRPP